jgi:hypothetical protein
MGQVPVGHPRSLGPLPATQMTRSGPTRGPTRAAVQSAQRGLHAVWLTAGAGRRAAADMTTAAQFRGPGGRRVRVPARQPPLGEWPLVAAEGEARGHVTNRPWVAFRRSGPATDDARRRRSGSSPAALACASSASTKWVATSIASLHTSRLGVPAGNPTAEANPYPLSATAASRPPSAPAKTSRQQAVEAAPGPAQLGRIQPCSRTRPAPRRATRRPR